MLAVGLLSGGLDSALAVQVIREQGIEVVALKFTSPFCLCDQGGCCHAAEVARHLGVRLVTLAKGEEYLEIVRHPKHGYGSGMNPCLDCRIYMLQAAKRYADSVGAAFLFTGEVLGQRPMSQHRAALDLIERKAGLAGKLLRPLSAALLPETEAERQGWVDRGKLLEISGRSRKPQLAEAERRQLTGYSCPAGGCLLTEQHFARRLRELLRQNEPLTMAVVPLLKIGRHYRINGRRIVVGRNERESTALAARPEAVWTIEPAVTPGPTTIITGAAGPDEVRAAAEITAAYTDGTEPEIMMTVRGPAGSEALSARRRPREEFAPYAI